MASWPSSLPEDLLIDGYSETLPDTTIRSNMEVGPAKVRRRISYNVTPVEGRIFVSTNQVASFTAFYNDDLGGGSLAFSMTHPRTDVMSNFRFTSSPKITADNSSNYWFIDLNLEIIP